jgi:hypothetical protein
MSKKARARYRLIKFIGNVLVFLSLGCRCFMVVVRCKGMRCIGIYSIYAKQPLSNYMMLWRGIKSKLRRIVFKQDSEGC